MKLPTIHSVNATTKIPIINFSAKAILPIVANSFSAQLLAFGVSLTVGG
ncbi:Uncharacterised protein [Staphylococcus aureus]|nr:Uncharacterised protein [Staphylococcus aureus]